MTLAEFSDLAQVVGSIAVVVSLFYVGFQLHQNTRQLIRNESNTAMLQGSAIRHLMLANPELVELAINAFGSDTELQPADELRARVFLMETTYMAHQVWDRVKGGYAPEDEFKRITPTLAPALCSARGLRWWRDARAAYRGDFVRALETALPALGQRE